MGIIASVLKKGEKLSHPSISVKNPLTLKPAPKVSKMPEMTHMQSNLRSNVTGEKKTAHARTRYVGVWAKFAIPDINKAMLGQMMLSIPVMVWF